MYFLNYVNYGFSMKFFMRRADGDLPTQTDTQSITTIWPDATGRFTSVLSFDLRRHVGDTLRGEDAP
jgi:hypothetical protein